MSWAIENQSYPVSRKEYLCNACEYLNGCNLQKDDFTVEQWEIYQKAFNEGGKIFKGEKYFKITGIWDGEWSTYRAKIDVTEIIVDNDWYDD